MLIGYHLDTNAILATPLKNIHVGKITEVWRILIEKFATTGVTPITYVMDNKALWDLKKTMKEEHV